MKFKILTLSFLLLLFSCETTNSSTSSNTNAITENQVSDNITTNSLLWEISGNGLTKSSYLFGTIHMICPEDFFLQEKVKTALASSDKLILEINMADPNEMQEMQKFMMSDSKISSSLNEAEITKLNAFLTTNFNMNLEPVDNYSPFMIYSLMTMKQLDCTTPKSYEMELINLAQENNKTIGGLETINEQFTMMNSIFTPKRLVSELDKFEESKTLFSNLINLYKAEDLSGLNELMKTSFETKEEADLMLNDRNQKWVSKMPSLMSSQSIFSAVGSAHLPGVINLLKAKGYTVKAIK